MIRHFVLRRNIVIFCYLALAIFILACQALNLAVASSTPAPIPTVNVAATQTQAYGALEEWLNNPQIEIAPITWVCKNCDFDSIARPRLHITVTNNGPQEVLLPYDVQFPDWDPEEEVVCNHYRSIASKATIEFVCNVQNDFFAVNQKPANLCITFVSNMKYELETRTAETQICKEIP
jgi:hypothetical protein